MKPDWVGIAAKAWFALGVIALIVVPAVLAWMGLGIIGLLFALPILAWIGARVLIKGTGEAFSWMSLKAVEEWQGAYYAFNDVQVRVYEEDDALWFVLDDVVKALGLKAVPQSYLATHARTGKVLDGRKVVKPEALDEMLGRRNEHEAIRFLQWMHRDVMKPWQRKRERP